MGPKLEDFKVLSTIGSGSHGTVRKVQRRQDGQVLVWKELNYGAMTEAEKKGLVLEVNLLRELRHPNIVRFLHHIVDRRATTLYILMEYCPGGDLKRLISRCRQTSTFLEEGFIWRVLKQICEALKVCHDREKHGGRLVLHRDIKPANVFLDANGTVKLGDFGLARTLSSETSFATTFVGTPYYMSPEVMQGRDYNEMSDMWSLGCLVYELCALHPPFQANTHKQLAAKIREARYDNIPIQYSFELKKMLSLLLTYEDFLRPTALMVLHHSAVVANTTRLGLAEEEEGKDALCHSLDTDVLLRRSREAEGDRDNVREGDREKERSKGESGVEKDWGGERSWEDRGKEGVEREEVGREEGREKEEGRGGVEGEKYWAKERGKEEERDKIESKGEKNRGREGYREEEDEGESVVNEIRVDECNDFREEGFERGVTEGLESYLDRQGDGESEEDEERSPEIDSEGGDESKYEMDKISNEEKYMWEGEVFTNTDIARENCYSVKSKEFTLESKTKNEDLTINVSPMTETYRISGREESRETNLEGQECYIPRAETKAKRGTANEPQESGTRGHKSNSKRHMDESVERICRAVRVRQLRERLECACGGMSSREWRERLLSLREAEVAVRERGVTMKEREREVREREHRVAAMEREAKQHLIRAQIYLRQSRPRQNAATSPHRPPSDLDTTVSADPGDEEIRTTARPDPLKINNPFLEMRGIPAPPEKHVSFRDNPGRFKSNTLDNPKSRWKRGNIFSLVDRMTEGKKDGNDKAGDEVKDKASTKPSSSSASQTSGTDNVNVLNPQSQIKLIPRDIANQSRLSRRAGSVENVYCRQDSSEDKVTQGEVKCKNAPDLKPNMCSERTRPRRRQGSLENLRRRRDSTEDKENQVQGQRSKNAPDIKPSAWTRQAGQKSGRQFKGKQGGKSSARVLQFYNVV